MLPIGVGRPKLPEARGEPDAQEDYGLRLALAVAALTAWHVPEVVREALLDLASLWASQREEEG